MDKMTPRKIHSLLILIFFLYGLISLPMMRYGRTHQMMVWNLFLAMVPLALSGVMLHYWKKTWIVILLGCFWLFFFPNAPYLITDFIHIGIQTARLHGSSTVFYFGRDFSAWLILVHITLAVFIGLACGFYSMARLQHRLAITHKKTSYALVGLTCLLSGIGVYIGRFLRFNSWDMVNPTYVLDVFLENLNLFAFEFIFLFGGLTLILYLGFMIFIDKRKL